MRRRAARHGTTEAERRLEILEEAVARLREDAEGGVVVVEGVRDRAALEWLGVGGRHVVVNQGLPLDAVADDLALGPAPVILLLDWDRTGARLLHRLDDILRAQVRTDTQHRRRLAVACQAHSVEEIPAELEALRNAAARGAGKH